MKRLLNLIILLSLSTYAYSAPPVRTQTYTPGEIISSSEVTENEDNIFNYLQAGVDTYADGTIVNADINGSANIQSDKLNLQSIAQDVGITSSGSFDNNGATTLDGTLAVNGAMTVSATSTFAGQTITDLGTVSTGVISEVDINGSNINADEFILGTNTIGDILYNDGSKFNKLPIGNADEVLTVSGSLPVWTNSSGIEIFTTSGTFTAKASTNYVYVTVCGAGGGGGVGTGGAAGGGGGAGECIVNHAMAVTPGNGYTVTIGAGGSGGAASGDNDGSAGGDSSFAGDTVPSNYTLTGTGGSGGEKGAGGGSGTGGSGATGNTTLSASGTSQSAPYSYAGGAGGDRSGSTGGAGGSSYLSLGAAANGGGGQAAASGNAGSGGGGGVNTNAGGNGGSGIVIIRYGIES